MGAISGGLEKIWNNKKFLLHPPLQLKLGLVPKEIMLSKGLTFFCDYEAYSKKGLTSCTIEISSFAIPLVARLVSLFVDLVMTEI